ncbi:MAG: ABC transporter substrate-binding protein [Hyphomicrobiaceae bacterium]|nr:ABC transporter substrate-binding protein [Hyphomicrobiaceae bacterium]
MRRLALLAVLLVLGGTASAAEKPRRIVSLNLCSDQIVLALVDRQRIAALSHLAADPLVSAVAAEARAIRTTRGEAEDVLALDPDLVIAGVVTTRATRELLRRLGRRAVVIPFADDLAAVRRAIATVAAAVGEVARGEALIAELDRRLGAAAPAPGERRPTAAIYGIGGAVELPGTLADALLRHAGLDNVVARLRPGASGAVSLEELVARPPDVLVLSGAAEAYRTVVADNLRHPALRAIMTRLTHVVVPQRLLLCGTHHVAAAVERLAAARRRLNARGAP